MSGKDMDAGGSQDILVATCGGDHDSLSSFLQSFRKLPEEDVSSSDNEPGASSATLERFLEEFRRLRMCDPVQTIPHEEVVVDQEKLREFLSKFGNLVELNRCSGDQINLWSVAGLGRNEIRNASVLAWLLDPREAHGLGPAVFQALLKRLAKRHAGYFPLPLEETSRYRVTTEHYSFDDDKNRVDLVVDGTNFTAFIEVKIDAREGERQIERYCELLNERRRTLGQSKAGLIYLTRSGAKPRDSMPPMVILATWNDVASTIEEVIKERRGVGSNFVDRLLSQFARHVAQF